jgi:hypothetical protein
MAPCRLSRKVVTKSKWQNQTAERNGQSLARLSKCLRLFSHPPCSHALSAGHLYRRRRGSRLILIEELIQSVPIGSRAPSLGAVERPPVGLGSSAKSAELEPATFRTPPAPYRERAYSLGPGSCCVCGQPVYRLGWHKDLWEAGPNKNAIWHCACVIAWQFWNAPNSQEQLLRRLQARRRGQTGGGSGKPLRSITGCRCFECGVTAGMNRGPDYSVIGDCRTFK